MPKVAAPQAADDHRNLVIEKPPADPRQYRFLTLPNGVAVVLISDPESDTAAACVTLNVGHMQDPKDLAGLAHLHEHLLFLGNKAYPTEGEYENFLSQHGGSSNAFTGMDETGYYFDVTSSQLAGEQATLIQSTL